MNKSKILVRVSLTVVVTSLVLSLAFPGLLWAQATLENPQPGSFQSGIGLISGWVCTATRVDISIDDGPPLQAAYGTSRADTRTVCGDDGNNGFGLLFNWNLLEDGPHTIRVLRNGAEEFARASFVVATLGLGEFPRGLSGTSTLSGFPQTGRTTRLQWQESIQNFVITNATGSSSGSGSASPGAALENPQPGSFQSGIGLISGWVCTATRVDISIDDGPPLQAAYGTSRADTRAVCGNEGNNGFGLLFNWNFLVDGLHTIRVLRNGAEEFARASFVVATLGLGEFPRGLSGTLPVSSFPQVGTSTQLQWQESLQNFVLTGALPPAVDSNLCTTQQGTAVDASGGQAFVSWTNPCLLSGNTAIVQLQVPGAAQQGAGARSQAVSQAFFACGTNLSIVQGNQEFRSSDIRLLASQGSEVCQMLLPGNTLDVTVVANTASALNFNVPFQVVYASQPVVNFVGTTEPPTTPPGLAVSPAVLDFGSVQVGSSKDFTVTVTNSGGGPLVGRTRATAPFSIVAGGAFNLTPGQTQAVTIGFIPPGVGPFSGSVSVRSNGGEATVSVSGTGVGEPTPRLSVSPTVLNYGNVPVGRKGKVLPFVVMNRGEGTLTGSVTIDVNFCSLDQSPATFTLAAGTSQTEQLLCDPPGVGPFSGSVSVRSKGGEATVRVSGTGGEPTPRLSVSPPTLDYGDVPVGRGGKVLPFVVTNRGGGTLTVTVTTAPPFSIENGGTLSLAVGQSQRVEVGFRPTTVGPVTGRASITSNGGSATVALTGTGRGAQ